VNSERKLDPKAEIERLLRVMARLRNPQRGCPWDREQSFKTIAPYTIEEAYEVAEAIAEGDLEMLKHELGDLLFQVVFHARMAEEQGAFDFAEVARALSDKMERRHPHVFGNATIADAEAQTQAWEAHKALERQAKAKRSGARPSLLDDVPKGFPALLRALKLQKRAGSVGFDWPAAAPVLDKLAEELAELRSALRQGESPERLADELGDLLFVCVNLARHLKVDPEAALRGTNWKFERRFRAMEEAFAAQGKKLEDASPEELDAAWEAAKADEHG
jgi:MazG family protein